MRTTLARNPARLSGLFILCLAAGWPAAPAAGGRIVCEGVLGNSGEAGETLVRFAPKSARGMGVACDRFGSLWDRAGAGRLNRYAPDGRLLASYPLAGGASNGDKLALAGDALVLLVGGRLYRLDVAAKPGTKPTPLKIEAAHISFGCHAGRLAAARRDGGLFLLDPAAGKAQDVPAGPVRGIRDLELTPDGVIHLVVDNGRMVQVRGGKLVEGGPAKRTPGERAQWLAGSWFGHAWHGTIKRFDAGVQPDPGVVLGGASGHFIGHLPQNSELLNGRGMARLSQRLYAVSGMGGVMHLLEWLPARRSMRIVRRIGALAEVRGIGLDGQGRAWAVAGSWQWADRPDTPMRFGVNAPEAPGIGQAVMLPSGAMVAPGWLWGQPALYSGPLDSEVRAERLGGRCSLRKGFVGSAVYRLERRLVLLVIDAAGKGQLFGIGSDGRFTANAGDVVLKTATPVKQFTSLAMKGEEVLLATGDGHVIELAPDGRNWKETRRWRRWGPQAGDAFGAEVHIAADAGRLWVSDTGRERVLCFDAVAGPMPVAFGGTDKPGTSLASLSAPRALAARGRRAVVFDSANQRLVKLRLVGAR